MSRAGFSLVAHDLPPLWDGDAVTWGRWTPEPWSTARLHVEDAGACDRCGSLGLRVQNRGTVHTNPPHRLYVSRCCDCGHDTVVDQDDVAWDLEPSDYTDQGSTPPARPAEKPPTAATSGRVPKRQPRRALPADLASCGYCGADIVWAITVAGPNGRGGKRQPLDPNEHLDGRIAVLSPRRGRLLARALLGDEQHDPPGEFLAMPHAATCQSTTRGNRWT